MSAERLKYTYIAVRKECGLSYGGSQSWGKGAVMKKYGHGVIAGTDLLLYLSLHKDYCKSQEFALQENKNGIWEAEEYMEAVREMRRKYFPLIPGFGMPGWLLGAGVNLYFRKNRIPLKACFGVLGRNLQNRMRAMLSHDIPVILAVGPNFPIPLKKHKLAFYKKAGECYQEACKTMTHYVTVTGMEEQWIKISSWGQEYYINMNEYINYVRKHSGFLVSNICYIRRKQS